MHLDWSRINSGFSSLLPSGTKYLRENSIAFDRASHGMSRKQGFSHICIRLAEALFI
jgi:hypothetical protein